MRVDIVTIVTMTQKIAEKVTKIAETEITKEISHKIVRYRTNWSPPRIDCIHNYWWKTFTVARKSMVK